MRPYRKIIILGLQAALLLIASPRAGAQNFVQADTVNVTAALNQSGSLTVTQNILLARPTRLSWTVYGRIDSLTVSADGRSLSPEHWSAKKTEQGVAIQSNELALNWQLAYQSSSQLIRSTERDQLYLPLFKEAGSTVEKLVVTFQLPALATGDGLVGNLYAIGGVGAHTTSTTDQRTIHAQATRIGPRAIVTLSAHWPTTVLRLKPAQELRLALANLELLPWLVIGGLLPLLAFIVLLRLLARQRHIETASTTHQLTPPDPTISPLIVGTLVEKKVYPREIVAMIIDLCRRGYVVIVKKSGQYYLSQRKPFDTNLETWERDILEALFPVANAKITTETLQQLNRQALFSPKVRRAFAAMYDVVTSKQYFAENPHRTRVRYKLVALSLYFLSVVGAIWIAVAGLSPYLLLPAAGTMIVCRLIIAYTPGLVHYTATGRQAQADWHAFGRYLALNEPLRLEASRNQIFEKYLGYAVALNVTLAWAKRFDLSNIVIVKPDWFISYEETSTAQFAQEIEEFSRSISNLLTEMRGPIVS